MMCKNPYMKDAVPYGCGQCLPCRVNKRRLWTHRIMLESMCHEDNAFITLTYDNENLPENASLDPKHLKDFQKRLRYHANIDLRFFSVGEYGEKTQRPHYHAAVFGFKGCASLDLKCPCTYCETLRRSWTKGHVLNGSLTQDSAGYIAGYVTKKMTESKSQLEEKYNKLINKNKSGALSDHIEEIRLKLIELGDRHPEFSRMSLKPGIGAPALQTIQDMLETEHGCNLIHELNDVPDIIKIGGKQMLLGSYLKNKLRERIGIVTKEHIETTQKKIWFLNKDMEWDYNIETTTKKRTTNETKEKKLSLLRQEKIEEYLSYREENPSLKA
jgi:hypothetical protein